MHRIRDHPHMRGKHPRSSYSSHDPNNTNTPPRFSIEEIVNFSVRNLTISFRYLARLDGRETTGRKRCPPESLSPTNRATYRAHCPIIRTSTSIVSLPQGGHTALTKYRIATQDDHQTVHHADIAYENPYDTSICDRPQRARRAQSGKAAAENVTESPT